MPSLSEARFHRFPSCGAGYTNEHGTCPTSQKNQPLTPPATTTTHYSTTTAIRSALTPTTQQSDATLTPPATTTTHYSTTTAIRSALTPTTQQHNKAMRPALCLLRLTSKCEGTVDAAAAAAMSGVRVLREQIW